MGVKDMSILKRNIISFNNIIYLIVISFVVYQIFSLYSIDIIYVSNNTISPILYVISSVVLIALTILFLYYLPILFVVEIYSFYINLQVTFVFKPKIIRKEVLYTKTYIKRNIFQKLQVIRC